jgi:xanthine dehydrogenase accessory factor
MTVYASLAAALREDRPVALATVVEGPPTGQRVLVDAEGVIHTTVADPDLSRALARDAAAELAAGRCALLRYGPRGEVGQDAVAVFVESFVPAPRMLVFGAMDFTAALVRVAKVLGYRVTVCDPRPVFTTVARFPEADEVVVRWPHELLEEIGTELGSRDAVCVLTHDARFDVPALQVALRSAVGYIGALGSRRTHARRRQLLAEAGVEEVDLDRVRAPIGLDLGARNPEETAVAICAEVIATRSGRSARPLSRSEGPIH